MIAPFLLAASLLVVAPSAASTRFEFATQAEAATILSARDDYILAMTSIDRAVRMKTATAPTEAEFISFISREARAWESAQIARLTPLVQRSSSSFLALPSHFLR